MTQDQAQDDTYDVVVLGAGSGGYACALRAAQLGLSLSEAADRYADGCPRCGGVPCRCLNG